MQPRRKRTWVRFRFSIAAVLLFLLLFSPLLAWVAATLRHVRMQRAAVAEIEAGGGRVIYDNSADPSAKQDDPPGPEFVREILGDDAFSHVTSVEFTGFKKSGVFEKSDEMGLYKLDLSYPDDDTLAAVGSLSRVRSIEIMGNEYTDAGLARIARLPALESLSISDGAYTSKGLAYFRSAPKLSRLELSWGPGSEPLHSLRQLQRIEVLELHAMTFGAEGFSALPALPNLKHLKINFCSGFEESDLRYIAKCRRLESLELSDKSEICTANAFARLRGMNSLRSVDLNIELFDDNSLADIAAIPNLETIVVDNAAITDAGLKSLSRLKALSSLAIPGAEGVTDAGVKHIAQLPELRHLKIQDTATTDIGLKHLHTASKLETVECGGRITLKAAQKLSQRNGCAVAGFYTQPGMSVYFTVP